MPAIDWDRLNELRSDIGEEDFADVAVMFVAELQQTLDGLSDATAKASDFHFLRGSAANLGFTALVNACSAAEAACNAQSLPDVDAVRTAFIASVIEAQDKVPELAA